MDEVGARIAANPAGSAGGGSSGHLTDRFALHAQIRCLPLHMQGIFSHTARAFAQQRVGFSCPVAGQHEEGGGGVEQLLRGCDDVNGACVDGAGPIPPPVTHEPIHLSQGIFDIVTFNPIDHI